MSIKSIDQIVEKHSRRLKASIEDVVIGVQNVSVAPSSLAVKKQAKMLANLTRSIQDGTWAKRISAVTLEEWKDKMINVGVGRISSGIDAAKAKMTAFYSQLIPFQANVSQKVASMPDLTLEDNLNRMTTFVREMSKFRKS